MCIFSEHLFIALHLAIGLLSVAGNLMLVKVFVRLGVKSNMPNLLFLQVNPSKVSYNTKNPVLKSKFKISNFLSLHSQVATIDSLGGLVLLLEAYKLIAHHVHG